MIIKIIKQTTVDNNISFTWALGVSNHRPQEWETDLAILTVS